MPQDDVLKKRFEELDQKANELAATRTAVTHTVRPSRWLSKTEAVHASTTVHVINFPKFKEWGTSVLSLLECAYGKDDAHYREFARYFEKANDSERHMLVCRGIFNAAREDYNAGYASKPGNPEQLQGEAADPATVKGNAKGLAALGGTEDPRRKQDIEFSRMAVNEARKCKSEGGAPRPLVGAVVVKDGKVVGKAYRGELAPAKGDHAEFTLLEKKLKDVSLAGATLYATLEPCTKRGEGKIPCVERIQERRIARVVIGTLDPNHDIRGLGYRALRDAGIEVDLFAPGLVTELEDLNWEFFRAHRTPPKIVQSGETAKPKVGAGPAESNPQSTAPWTCDTCQQEIRQAKDGWVEWITHNKDGRFSGRGLRLVHHKPASPKKTRFGCQYDSREVYQNGGGSLSDLSLPEFLGPNGLMLLLSMLAEEGLPSNEVIELIKRLHIPGYEQARSHLRKAVAEGIIEPNLPDGFYWQSEIARVVEWVAKQSAEEE